MSGKVEGNITDPLVVCYPATMITTSGVWQGDNPLDYSLPTFIVQLCLVLITTRTFVFILKPLRQPRVISEILGGVVLGPSVMGRYEKFVTSVFPLRSVTVLETVANIGLLYFLFLVGVEMDLTVIRRTGKKAIAVAGAGMIVPFVIGTSSSIVLRASMSESIDQGTFLLFLGVALSVTAFPVLARILAELKLLNTDIGRIAMSSAIINDICAWILLALAIVLSEDHSTTMASLWVITAATAFVLLYIFAVRPAMEWVVRCTPEGEVVSDFYICFILAGVLVSGFLTDMIGVHAIFGAFVFGLIIPNGPLGSALIEKLEDFVSGLLLPLFFAISGLKTDVSSIKEFSSSAILLLTIIMASAGKIVATLVIALFYKMPLREGLSLGFLMNTKGLIEMIVLNIGRDRKVLDEQSFSIMVITAVLTTGIITPIVTIIYRPARRYISYKRRTIQSTKPDSGLQILACIHNPRDVPTFINLLEASHPTKKCPICIYVLHLVELTGRASAMLIVHNTRRSGHPALNRTQAQSDHIVNAFENYEQHSAGVMVQPLTAISPYSSMHEDICNLAEDKRVAFIILPFHKQQTVDGSMESTNPVFRSINQNVLANAPCSVGILVDRGLGGTTGVSATHVSHHVALLFFGGPDDRESLAYASRMASHPEISLLVARFLPGEEVMEKAKVRRISAPDNSEEERRQKQLDDDFLKEFRLRNASDNSVVYTERVVNNGEETVSAIRGLDTVYDLFIVGRGEGLISPLTAGLTVWSECPELGTIGDLLASSDFTSTVSVLVMQQYVGAGEADSPAQEVAKNLHNFNWPRATTAVHDHPQRPSDRGYAWNNNKY